MKEERMAILRMLEKGTISADEAERLLNAMNETENKKDISESINNVLAKTGNVLEGLAKNLTKKAGAAAKVVSEKAEEAKPEIKKAAKAVKEKVSEAAVNIKEDIKNRKNGEDIFEADYREKNDDETFGNTDVNTENQTDTQKQENSVVESNEPETAEFKTEEQTDNFFEDDDRDYEAEFNRMMSETNGGDIFGEVFNPINDAIFEAQREWEEQKKNDDNGELR